MADNTSNVSTENQNTEDSQNQNETVTLTQSDLDKKLQGAADKVRTEYSKKVKDLEAKIKELTPPAKTEAEIEFEKRLANLEAREKRADLLASLTKNGISHDFADYFKSDVDIDGFKKIYDAAIDAAVKAKIKNDGYKPESHKSGDSVTKEDFKKMTMDEKEELFNNNPDLYRSLVGRK